MGLYEVVLSVMNLVILISSTACLYLASIMINIYLLPYLELVNSHFSTVSYLILAIGFFLLLFSFLGIAAALSNSRPALILYAVLMCIVVLMELASVFVSMELRQELERKIMFQTVPKEMTEEMSRYWYDEDIRYKWDTLQRDFQCCGALNLRTGFQDWDRIRHNNIGTTDFKQRGVPDSCCLLESVNCGAEDRDIFTDIHAYEKINIHGCLTIMKERLARDIAPLLLTYIGCGVVLCLISIISLVLASAFVASISRKERHRTDGLGMYEPPKSHGTGMNRYDETSINAEIIKTLDSGLGGGGSLRSITSHGTTSSPRTPIIKQGNTGTGSHRASLYIEPTSESETVI